MLHDVLSTLRTRLLIDNIGGLDGRNTDRVFVSPVLEALGWNLSNPEDAVLGFSIKGLEQAAEIYYGLYLNKEPLLLIDLKPLYSDLTNASAAAKTFITAQNSAAKYLAISNGVEWYIYSVRDKAKLEITIDIREKDAEAKLLMLTKDAVEKSLIDQYVEENEVQAVLKKELLKNRGYKISESTHKNINQLRTKIVSSRSVKDQEISNSLIVENVLKVFLDSMPVMHYHDISNEVILRKRIIESLKKFYI